MNQAVGLVKFESFANGELLSFIQMGTDKAVLEDTITLIESNHRLQLLALTDGMGGHSCGEKASELLHRELMNQFKKMKDETYISHHILEAIEKADQKVKQLKTGAGATLAIAEIGKNYVRCYHAGDTKILVLGSRGAVKYNSVSHSPRGYALASGAFENNSGKLPPSNIVSNGLGFNPLTIEVTQKIELADNDLIFISSDYLDDVIAEEKLIELLTSDSFSQRGDALIRQAMEKDQGHFSDDCSFQLFKISISAS